MLTPTVVIFYIALVMFIVTSLWTLITLTRSKLLFFYIPIVVLLIISSIFVYDSILGQPRPGPLPPGEHAILQYNIQEPEFIYVWALTEDRTPIAYKLPYTPKLHQQLDGVAEGVRNGSAKVKVDSKVTKQNKTNSTETSREEYGVNYEFIELKMQEK